MLKPRDNKGAQTAFKRMLLARDVMGPERTRAVNALISLVMCLGYQTLVLKFSGD